MPKGLIAGTLYLVTLECGDYVTYTTPFRLYGTRAKADRFIERIQRHHAKKPKEPGDDATDEETSKWYQDLQEWMLKHPGGRDNAYYDPSEWAVRPMLVC